MLAIKKKTILIIIAITVVVMVAVVGGVQLLMKSGDPNVQAYKDALSESVQGEYYHYTKTEKLLSDDGTWYVYEPEEVYKHGANRVFIDWYEDKESYFFNYEGYTYQATAYKNGYSEIKKREGITPLGISINGIEMSYYNIDDRNVTYEETDTQFIVTYNNQYMIGAEVDGYFEKAKDGYTSAVSVAYFDKSWNMQKLEVRETWDSITEDGDVYERIREVVFDYYDTPEKEIKEFLKNKQEYLESLLGN